MTDGPDPVPGADATEAPAATVPTAKGQPGTALPSGRRQAFRDVRRQLTDDDLQSPGVHKLILDELERAETECDQYRAYLERYHEADRKAAVLEEKLRPSRAVDVLFGVGVGVGSAIMGLAPTFWMVQPLGQLCLAVGAVLVVGATIGKLTKG